MRPDYDPNKDRKYLYMRLPGVKKIGVSMDITEEQQQEFIKCKKDPIYFYQNYLKTESLDKGMVPFDPYEYQKEMTTMMVEKRFSIFKLSRQSGKTTIVSAFLLWLTHFNEYQNLAILANKQKTAIQILQRIRNNYRQLPMWMKHGVETWNKQNVVFENGSSIVAGATSADAFRGYTFNVVFLDEFAYVDDNIAREFYTSIYPTISSGETGKIIIVSTPKGKNLFYEIWMKAVRGENKYVYASIDWKQVPRKDPEAFKKDTIANLEGGILTWEREFEVKFLSSSGTLIDPGKLEQMDFLNPVRIETKIYKIADEEEEYPVNIYKEPVLDKTEWVDGAETIVPGHYYMIAVDGADGVGQEQAALSVIDLSTDPYEQVAAFAHNKIKYDSFTKLVSDIGTYYNNAYLLVESNDATIATVLYEKLEYKNIFKSIAKAGAGTKLVMSGKNSRWGIKMSEAIRRDGCMTFKTLAERNRLLIPDFKTLSELSSFVAKPKPGGGVKYEHEPGKTDDLVMTLVMASWAVDQDLVKGLMETDFRVDLLNRMGEAGVVQDQRPPIFMIRNETPTSKYIQEAGDVWVVAGE